MRFAGNPIAERLGSVGIVGRESLLVDDHVAAVLGKLCSHCNVVDAILLASQVDLL